MELNKNLEKIKSIIIGIRYKKSFKINDISGSIIDYIFDDNGSPFDRKIFPRIEEVSGGDKRLYNPNTDEYWSISPDDMILQLSCDDGFDKCFNLLENKVIPFIEKLFKDFEIKNIIRFGTVYVHEFSKAQIDFEFLKTLRNELPFEIEDLKLSFSKKSELESSIFRKDINDYENVNYRLFLGSDLTGILGDFQHYYVPLREDIRDCDIKSKFKLTRKYLEEKLYEALKI